MTDQFIHDSDRPDRGDGGDRRVSKDDIAAIFNIGKVQSDLDHLKEGQDRMEAEMKAAFVRGGVRMGEMEKDIQDLKVTVSTHKEKDEAVAESVKDLKEGRKWFIMTIGSTVIATIWGWIKH